MVSLGSEFLDFVGEYDQDIVELFFVSAMTVDSLQKFFYVLLHISDKFNDSWFLLCALFSTYWLVSRSVCIVIDVFLEVHSKSFDRKYFTFKLLLPLFLSFIKNYFKTNHPQICYLSLFISETNTFCDLVRLSFYCKIILK